MKTEKTHRYEVRERISPKEAAEMAAKVNGKLHLGLVETSCKSGRGWSHEYFMSLTSMNGSNCPIAAIPIRGIELTTGQHTFQLPEQTLADAQQMYINRNAAREVVESFASFARPFGVQIDVSKNVIATLARSPKPSLVEVPYHAVE